MRTKLLLILFLLYSALFLHANIREVSFYCPVKVAKSPVIDGKLDDECWTKAAPYTATYEYFKPNPGPGALQNTIKMVYDEKGLYISIINHEKNPANIRKTITNRDNGSIWTDDCAELYIDSQGQGVGFRRFTVNALGTFGDILRIDGAVTRNDWNSNGTIFKTSINSDCWIIESFFPWEDLGAKAKAGDIWMFCHTRYAWPGGKFIGTTSSPGGNYAATGNFGYLYFAETPAIDQTQISKIIMQRVAPPWCVKINDKLISNHGNGLQTELLADVINREKNTIEKMLPIKNIPNAFKKEYDKIIAEYKSTQKLSDQSVQKYRTLNTIAAKIDQFQWKVKLINHFN